MSKDKNKDLTNQMSRSQLVNALHRLLEVEKSADELIEEQRRRILKLERTFSHAHVDNGSGNLCKQCGLHITDQVHSILISKEQTNED